MIWHALVDPTLSGRLLLTLLHSLWQVALLALVAWCIDRTWRSRSVERRYVVNVVALLAALAAMPITFALIGGAGPTTERAIATNRLPTHRESARGSISAPLGRSEFVARAETRALDAKPEADGASPSSIAGRPLFDVQTADPSTPRWLALAPWVVALYVAGVTLMLARLVLATIRANRLAARADAMTDGPLVGFLRALARQWSMRVVPTLARAERIIVPQVVGLVRPTILIPAAAMSGLSTGELEMILAHELAHVRRYDTWVNLIQRLAEAILFFNPALWYLSRRTSTLREYCCDEMTCRAQPASTFEPRLRYANALVRVVELANPSAATGHDLASLAASGRSPSEMRRRVARLFGEPLREPLRFSRGGVLTLGIAVLVLFLAPIPWRSNADSSPAKAEEEVRKSDSEDENQEKSADLDADGEADNERVKLPIVVAEHVVLFDGKEIVTWSELRDKIAALPDPRQASPQVYVTRGARAAGKDETANAEVRRLERRFRFRGYSIGSLRPRSDLRYDRVRTVLDLAPLGSLRLEGRVVDDRGEPVDGAEVLLVTPVDESISYKSYHVALVRGKIRNRLEHVMTVSDGDGQFALYPNEDSKYYIVAIHPDAGFALALNDQFTAGDEVQLLSWAGLITELDPVLGEQQTASLSTQVRAADGLPEVVFNQYWSDLKEEAPGLIFPYAHIPPIFRTTIQRDFRNINGGGSVALAGASVSLWPGEVRELGLGPLSEQQRAQLERTRRDFQKRLENQPGDDDGARLFRLNVVGPDETPVANALLELRMRPAPSAAQILDGDFVLARSYGVFAKTDEQGRHRLKLPRRPDRLNISIKQPGYAPYSARWTSNSHPQEIPLEFTARLDAG